MFNYIQKCKPHVIFLKETHLTGSKILALKQAFIGHAFHSLYLNYARGVSVLVSKSLTCTPKTIVTDPYGRFVLVVLINDMPYTFVTVYIPSPFTLAGWEAVLTRVLQATEGPIILSSVLNTVLSPEKDRLNARSSCSSPLANCMSHYGMVEACRWKIPDTLAYSCYYSTYNTFSRLDMCFLTRDILPRVVAVQYLPRAISDHSPLLLTVTVGHSSGYNLWRLFERSSATANGEFWRDNREEVALGVTWDAFKATLKGSTSGVI